MTAPQQNNGAPAPGPSYPPNFQGNPPPQEPPFIPYQKPNSPPPPYYGQNGGYPPYIKPKTKMATASLILGAIALGLVLLGLFGDISVLSETDNLNDLLDYSFPVVVCGLLALIFGLISRSRFHNYPPDFPARRNSLLGIIFGSISLGILVLIYLLAISLISYLFVLFFLWV